MRRVLTFVFLFIVLSGTEADFNSNVLDIWYTFRPPLINGDKGDWGGAWVSLNKSPGDSVLSELSARLFITYDYNNLYLIVEVNGDDTPNYDSIAFPEPKNRDNVEVYITMDTVTYKNGQFHKNCWLLRKQRIPLSGGVDGVMGIGNGGDTSTIDNILQKKDFQVVSSGEGNPYYVEWQIPWYALLNKECTDSLINWSPKMFKFDLVVTDNDYRLVNGKIRKIALLFSSLPSPSSSVYTVCQSNIVV